MVERMSREWRISRPGGDVRLLLMLMFWLTGALVMPIGARGAAVTVVRYRGSDAWDEMRFIAAPGEHNHVVIDGQRPRNGAGLWTIHDEGAVIAAGASCTTIDEHTATCRKTGADRSLEYARLELGDMNDTLRMPGLRPFQTVADGGVGDDDLQSGPAQFETQGAHLRGGTGNDRLTGLDGWDVLDGDSGDDEIVGGKGEDRLDGGGGRDRLIGGDGRDALTDGDRDGGAADVAPGADVMSGGRGEDTVSYKQRSAPVSVDLERPSGNGEPGENDEISGVEDAAGGDGDDALAGSVRTNWLFGKGGRDRLVGRGGSDQLMPGPGGARAVCGRGRDYVQVSSARDFLEPDCETASVGVTNLPAYPVSSPDGSLRYRAVCPGAGPDSGFTYVSCSGSLRIVDTSPRHRLLARAVIPRGRRPRTVPLVMTHLGRRLGAHHRRREAIVQVRGRHYPRTDWSISFRLRSR